MKPPSIDTVRDLIRRQQGVCVTIGMNIGDEGAASSPRRWSACVARARTALAAIPGIDAERVLAPLPDLLDPASWNPAAKGLIACCSGAWSTHHWSSTGVDEVVVVSRRFQLRPWLQAVHADARFFLLDLTHGRVHLFVGDAGSLESCPVPALPASFDEAVGTEHPDRVVSARSSGPALSVWHGQGRDESARREDELEFVRAVDAALAARLRGETAPLVVAGAGKVVPLFQSHCSYAHVLTEVVHGSFAHAPLRELHAKAWPIVRAHLEDRERQAVERHRAAVGGDRATDELTSMARAAVEGRVHELFVARGAHVQGHMDASTGTLALQTSRESSPYHEDVLDALVEAVLLRGGEVHAIPADRMPSRSPAAATLRW